MITTWVAASKAPEHPFDVELQINRHPLPKHGQFIEIINELAGERYIGKVILTSPMRDRCTARVWPSRVWTTEVNDD